VGAALVITYSGSFERWNDPAWSIMMALAAVAVTIEFAVLRWAGWRLSTQAETAKQSEPFKLRSSQFGLIHLFVWGTAIVPLLLVAKRLNFLVISNLDSYSMIPILLFVTAMATVNLAAIWMVLGPGRWLVRLSLLIAVTLTIAYGCQTLLNYLVPKGFINRSPYRFVRSFDWVEWPTWFVMSAVLATSLLCFLRGRGYMLVRRQANLISH